MLSWQPVNYMHTTNNLICTSNLMRQRGTLYHIFKGRIFAEEVATRVKLFYAESKSNVMCVGSPVVMLGIRRFTWYRNHDVL